MTLSLSMGLKVDRVCDQNIYVFSFYLFILLILFYKY